MIEVDTFVATIYVGFREEYSDILHNMKEVEVICQKYCNENPLCVTITPTKFIYKDGFEDGCAIGLMNYPKFPSNPDEILQKAIAIAEIFIIEFKQLKISIVCNNKTYTLKGKYIK